MPQKKTHPGFWVSWATNVAVGSIVALALWVTHDFPLLQHLERIGGDFAMRLYAHDDRPLDVPRIVILLVDQPTTAIWAEGKGTIGGRLVDLIRLLRHDGQKPRTVKSVILDVKIEDTVAEDIQKALVEELEQPGPRVVLPLQGIRPTEGEAAWEGPSDRFDRAGVSGKAHIVRGVSLLSRDEDDGVVRHLTTEICVLRHVPAEMGAEEKEVIAWKWVPTLAEAAVHGPDEQKCDPTQQRQDRLILFRTDAAAVPGANEFITLSAREMIDKDGSVVASDRNLALLMGAHVLIGQTQSATWTDRHLTPVGPMPGVLVHANALFTLLKGKQSDSSTTLYELLAIVILGAWFAVVSQLMDWIGSQRSEFVLFALHFAGLSVGFLVAAIGLGTFWTLVAASALREGIVVGTFVPVFAVGLEKLLEAGELLITGIHEGIYWATSRVKAIYKAVAGYLTAAIAILVVTATSIRRTGQSWHFDNAAGGRSRNHPQTRISQTNRADLRPAAIRRDHRAQPDRCRGRPVWQSTLRPAWTRIVLGITAGSERCCRRVGQFLAATD
jgi:hypothetical protein